MTRCELAQAILLAMATREASDVVGGATSIAASRAVIACNTADAMFSEIRKRQGLPALDVAAVANEWQK